MVDYPFDDPNRSPADDLARLADYRGGDTRNATRLAREEGVTGTALTLSLPASSMARNWESCFIGATPWHRRG